MSAQRAWLVGLGAGLLLAGCSQSEGGQRRFRYAEAVEVPVAVTERDQLAALLAGFAHRNGLAFHDFTPRAQRLSNGRRTIELQLERPLTNGRLWPEIEAVAVGNEAVLITFAEPLDQGIADQAANGRAAALAELRRRWPATSAVRLMPDGGLPTSEHRHGPARIGGGLEG
jgi:hypothetical protein